MGLDNPAGQSARSSKALWLGLFFSPVVWSVYHLIGYALVEAACLTALPRLTLAGLPALQVVLVVLAILATAAIVWNFFWSYRSWRHYAAQSPEEEHPLQAYDRDEFMALSGVLLSGLFFLLILMSAYPFFVLNPCG